MTQPRPLLSLRGITKRFVQRVDLAGKIANAFGAGMRETVVQAVSDVDLDVAEGEVVGLVGESGCGKSTLGRIVAGIMPQTAGAMTWRGQDVAAMGAEARHALAARRADDLPGPVRLAQSAAARLRDRRRGAAGARAGRPRRAGRLRRRNADQGRPRSRLRQPLPAPVLRRPAPAHRHRPRSRGEAKLHRLRRGGGGARRLDPGAGAEPVHGPAPGARPHLPVHQPQSRGGRASLRPRGDHVSRPRWSRSRRPTSCSRGPTIPTPRRCWPRCPSSKPSSGPTSRSPARSRRRSIRRPAAPSIRAARTPSPAARSSARRSGKSPPATSAPAI